MPWRCCSSLVVYITKEKNPEKVCFEKFSSYPDSIQSSPFAHPWPGAMQCVQCTGKVAKTSNFELRNQQQHQLGKGGRRSSGGLRLCRFSRERRTKENDVSMYWNVWKYLVPQPFGLLFRWYIEQKHRERALGNPQTVDGRLWEVWNCRDEPNPPAGSLQRCPIRFWHLEWLARNNPWRKMKAKGESEDLEMGICSRKTTSLHASRMYQAIVGLDWTSRNRSITNR